MINKILNNYFLILFSLIPISILIGSTASLINVIIIDFSFLIFLIYIKDFSFLKNNTIKYFLILYLYLIFNTFISIEPELGMFRNLGFFRIIIFFAALNYFFNREFFSQKLIIAWLFIISVVVFDVYFEKFNGTNLLGFPKTGENIVSYGSRLVSFFKDEPIVGGFLYSFFLMLIGFLFEKNKKINVFLIVLTIIFFLSIFITGERANTIKALTGVFIFFFFLKKIDIKVKLLSIAIILISLTTLIYKSEYFKLRYVDQIKSNLNVEESYYLHVYRAGLQVFKNYPLFGVGNKNFRVETCKNPNNRSKEQTSEYLCTTHPHQIYLEFLSEHGLIGTVILLFLLYKLIFSKIIFVIKHGNCIQLGSLTYLITIFLPMIPSGAFFNDYSLTLFTINLGILYSSSSNLNIFTKK